MRVGMQQVHARRRGRGDTAREERAQAIEVELRRIAYGDEHAAGGGLDGEDVRAAAERIDDGRCVRRIATKADQPYAKPGAKVTLEADMVALTGTS